MPGLHHVELWVAEFDVAQVEWAWLLDRLGFELDSEWPNGMSWSADGAYLTVTTSPALTSTVHDRRRSGVNHLAFKAGQRSNVDALMVEAIEHGWLPLYHDRYPHAGGDDHYAGWLENSAGFKAEVVADEA
ncbi:MAG: glyoxalase [Rhodoglobus sp.]